MCDECQRGLRHLEDYDPPMLCLGGHNALFYVSTHFYIKVTLSTNLAVILIHSTKLRSRYWNVTVITLPGFGVISVGKLGSWSLFKRICDFRFPDYDINLFLFLGVTFNWIPWINYPSSLTCSILSISNQSTKYIILPCWEKYGITMRAGPSFLKLISQVLTKQELLFN